METLTMQSRRRSALRRTEKEAIWRMVSSIRYTIAVLDYDTSLPRIILEEFKKSYQGSSLGDLGKLKFNTWAAELSRHRALSLAMDDSGDDTDEQAKSSDVDFDAVVEMEEKVADESHDEAKESSSQDGNSRQEGPPEMIGRNQEPDRAFLTPQMMTLLENRQDAIKHCLNSTIKAMVELINLAVMICPDRREVLKTAYQVLQSHYLLHLNIDVSYSNINMTLGGFIVCNDE